MRTFARLGVAALLSSAAFGQSGDTSPKPAFALADIHTSAHTTNPNPFMSGGVLRGGRYDLRNATMVDLIKTAWNVDADTVLGGPNWLETDRFDVIAKAAPNTPPETIRLMLQALLADRFQLEIHKDTRPLPGFALTLGKGKPKLKESEGTAAPGCQPEPQKSEPGAPAYVVVTCHHWTMDEFAPNLRLMASAYLTSPVVNATGLQGSWDFQIKWSPRQQLAQAGSEGISIFDAVDKQLGLKLVSQKLPTPVLIVDRVNERPTDNSPEVSRNLPPAPPAEFEVAVIKPSMPDTRPMGRIEPGGRIEMQAITLKMLIAVAWNIDFTANDLIAGAPKFVDSTHFDVTAKAYAGTSTGPALMPQVDIDDVRLMLRALLVDRFKLATHMEDRPVNTYTLVAGKPKLAKADPANRTGWKEGPPPDGKDPREANPAIARVITFRNMSMAQFADVLQKIAPAYFHSPVLDETGLEGNYDFTLAYSAPNQLQNGPGRGGNAGQSGGAVPAASDPNGAISIFEAVSSQLGLKLEEKKRPVPVLVIDHVEEKPTDN
jgi:uncharacterized protein (TIGR03435 family)